MAQKPLSPGDRAVSIAAKLLPADVDQLDQLAARWGVTRSAAVREVIRAKLAEQATGPPGQVSAA